MKSYSSKEVITPTSEKTHGFNRVDDSSLLTNIDNILKNIYKGDTIYS